MAIRLVRRCRGAGLTPRLTAPFVSESFKFRNPKNQGALLWQSVQHGIRFCRMSITMTPTATLATISSGRISGPEQAESHCAVSVTVSANVET